MGVHSPVQRPYAQRLSFFGDRDYVEAQSPPDLVKAKLDLARTLTIDLDAGGRGQLAPHTKALDAELDALGISRERNSWPKPHSGDYFSPHAADYLRTTGAP